MMAIPVPAWLPWKKRRRHDPFTRATHGDLDIVMPLPYDMSEATQEQGRAMVRELIGQLKPAGLDAGSREVLNNLINARADRLIAQLDAERDERQAVALVLVGLARQEVARRKGRYDADLARALHAREALATAFATLSGKESADQHGPFPARFDDHPIGSTLGPVTRDQNGPAPAEPGTAHASPDTARTAGTAEREPDRSDDPDQPAHRRAPTTVPDGHTSWPTNGNRHAAAQRVTEPLPGGNP